jgi:outer membrane cobalamin receptor
MQNIRSSRPRLGKISVRLPIRPSPSLVAMVLLGSLILLGDLAVPRPAAAATQPAATGRQSGPDTRSTVRGVVTDPHGARVPGARVVLAGPLSVEATTQADSRGEFELQDLRPGHYELRVASDGFRADPVQLDVEAGRDLEVPVPLHISAVTESVVVSAAQVEVPLGRAADSVTVLSAGDLRARQVETVADALRTVPGLTVARNGGRGSLTSLFPRGGESDYTLVLVDGIKANAFGGGYDFSTLSAADVDRVEVVRGPESALFGADAIGAVVQVVTRRGGRPGAEGLVEGGSFGTARASGSAWGSHRGWSWGASAERVSSDGFTGIAPATGERVSNDDFLEKHASFSGGWHAARGADVRGSANLTWSDRGFPGAFGSNPIGAYTGVDRISRGKNTTQQYGARWAQPLSRGGHHVRETISVSAFDLGSDFTSPDFITGAPTLSASGSHRMDARAQTDVDVSAALGLSFGGEFQRERATSSFITANSAGPVPIHRRVLGAFAEARWQPRSSLTLTAGVRAEQFERDRLASDLFATRPAFDTDTRGSVNPRVSAAFFLAGPSSGVPGWTRLHAAAGTGMRAPDALEIAFTDNPGLKPERSRSVEAGVDQALAGERAVVGVTAFYNRYDDLIVAVGPSLKDASRYRTDNISNAQARGIECSASLRPRSGLAVRLAYTFLDTEVLAIDGLREAAPPFHVGDALLRRPRHAASLDVTYARSRLAAFAHAGARTRTLEPEPNFGTFGGLFFNPGYTVVDAGASWRLARAIEVIGRVGNLLDRHYEEAFGFPALGRNATIGVRIAAVR